MRREVLVLLCVFTIFHLDFVASDPDSKRPVPFEQKPPRDAKYNNPDQIRDREWGQEAKAYKKGQKLKKVRVHRPAVLDDAWKSRFRKPFHPAWMDRCDPYHCNDYHKPACGLNRDTMRFKWFQSGCHIALNNVCANFRGALQYDMIDPKWCTVHVYLRSSGCPQECSDKVKPVCGVSSNDNHVVLFKNYCYFTRANCKEDTFNEYEQVHMDICRNTFSYEKLRKA